MKRYGYLYPAICSTQNIQLAHKNARKGKLHYKEVQMVDENPARHFRAIQEMLRNKTFQNSEYTVFVSTKGKRREIFKLPYYPDRIVHHCIMQVTGPIWTRSMIADTFSCIKNRGIHKAADRVRAALRDKPGTRYCLKCDVKQFYPSIDHDVLKAIIRRKIKDPELLWLLDAIIDSAPGVPIGNYLSQQFGNLYLTGMDHWLKEEKRCKYYFRYCDDMVVLHRDKERLGELREEMQDYLGAKLKLRLKENWQIFPVDSRGIDFLGYRFFHDYILLRKGIAIKFKRRMRYIKNHWRHMRSIEVVSAVMSYYGWLQYANSLNLIKRHIDDDIVGIVTEVCKRRNMKNPILRVVGCR